MILYVTQVTFLWFVFSVIYYVLLSNKTMFRFNRWYLLTTLLGSLLIPISKIFSSAEVITVFSFAENQLNDLVINTSKESISFDWTILFNITLLIGMLIFAIRFFIGLRKMWILFNQSEKVIYNQTVVCIIEDENQVFSFWEVIFMSREIFDNINMHTDIWMHEKTHVQQKHSLDIILIELCRIVFWFHPLVYLYGQNMRMNHEYLADENALKQMENVKAYQHKLLNYMENKTNYLASTFNFKLTQKRFIMMKTKTNQQSKTIAKLFAVLGMITAVTLVACSEKKEKSEMPYVEYSIEPSDDESMPLEKVEVKAIPPRGMDEFRRYVSRKLTIPENYEGDVSLIFRFVVEKDGSLTNFEVEGTENEIHEKLAEQIIDIMKNSGKWIPAQNGGEIVSSTFMWKITFALH